MRRKLFNFLALASLVGAIASMGMWARSYVVTDAVGFDGPSGAAIVTFRGAAGLAILIGENFGKGWFYERSGPEDIDLLAKYSDTAYQFYGLSIVSFSKPPGRVRLVAMTFWILVPVLLITPVLWLLRALSHRNDIAGNICPRCGYDLRATPDRCPECGAVGRIPISADPG